MKNDKKRKYRLMKNFWKDPTLEHTSSCGANEYTLHFKRELYCSHDYGKPYFVEVTENPDDIKEIKRDLHFNEVVKDCLSNIVNGKKGYCFSISQLKVVIHRLKDLGYVSGQMIVTKIRDLNIWFIEIPKEKRCSP